MRPEGFENPYKAEQFRKPEATATFTWRDIIERRHQSFEEGANHMVELLRKMGQHLSIKDQRSQVEIDSLAHEEPIIPGTWVFIEDEG